MNKQQIITKGKNPPGDYFKNAMFFPVCFKGACKKCFLLLFSYLLVPYSILYVCFMTALGFDLCLSLFFLIIIINLLFFSIYFWTEKHLNFPFLVQQTSAF